MRTSRISWVSAGALAALGLLGSAPAGACTVCRPRVQAGIYAADYTPNLLAVLLPLVLLLGLGVALYYAPVLRRRFR